jgi:hypothetical protein
MKHYLYIIFSAIALSTCSCAHAETWTMPNNAGGQIVLTDRKCSEKYPSLMQMYARSGDGTTLNGCWALYDGYVHVSYDDRTERTYDPRMFVKMENY